MASQVNVLSSQLGTYVGINGKPFGGFAFNNVSWQAQVGDPLLYQLEEGKPLDGSLIANVQFTGIVAGDIIVNNLDVQPAISHPYHLHGRSFWIVGRGQGTVDEEGLKVVRLNTTNPVKRDTLVIPSGSWAVLRESSGKLLPRDIRTPARVLWSIGADIASQGSSQTYLAFGRCTAISAGTSVSARWRPWSSSRRPSSLSSNLPIGAV